MKWLARLQALEKNRERPEDELTKLTKGPSVSFVSARPAGDERFLGRAGIGERAAIAQYDGAPNRAETERRACEAAIARWLHDNPPTYADQDHCASCGGWLLDDLLPLAEHDQLGRTVWVHAQGGCWRAYMRKRHAEAEAGLSQ